MAINAIRLHHFTASLSPHLAVARISIPSTVAKENLRLCGIGPAPEPIAMLPARNCSTAVTRLFKS